jgi:MarR family 2-MHQ and catechol resistance regulon transcriptional repressor
MQEDTSGIHLWLVLMKAHAALERIAVDSIANTGICLTDFKILEILLHRGALPVNTLAVRVGLSSGSATAAIDRLAARGLVERRASAQDRRERVVHPTEAGRTLAASAFEKHCQDMEVAAKVLDETERLQLLGLLRRFGKKAENTARNSADLSVDQRLSTETESTLEDR